MLQYLEVPFIQKKKSLFATISVHAHICRT